MCLGIPAKVEEILGQKGIVSIGDAKIEVNVVLVEGLSKDDYVLVHAGFAIARVDEQEALDTLTLVKEMIASEVY